MIANSKFGNLLKYDTEYIIKNKNDFLCVVYVPWTKKVATEKKW